MRSRIFSDPFLREAERLACGALFGLPDRVSTGSRCGNGLSADLGADKTGLDDSRCR